MRSLHVACRTLHAARVKYAAHRLYDRQRTPPIPCNAQNTVEWPPTCSSCLGQASPPSPHRSSRPLHGNSAATDISNSRADCRGRGPMVVCEERGVRDLRTLRGVGSQTCVPKWIAVATIPSAYRGGRFVAETAAQLQLRRSRPPPIRISQQMCCPCATTPMHRLSRLS